MFDAAPLRSTMSARRRRPTNLRSASISARRCNQLNFQCGPLGKHQTLHDSKNTLQGPCTWSFLMILMDVHMVKRYTRASASSVFTHTYQISYACVKYHTRSFLQCLQLLLSYDFKFWHCDICHLGLRARPSSACVFLCSISNGCVRCIYRQYIYIEYIELLYTVHDHLLATYQIYQDPIFFHAASEAQKRNWERKVELAGCPRSTAAVPIITLSINAMGDTARALVENPKA